MRRVARTMLFCGATVSMAVATVLVGPATAGADASAAAVPAHYRVVNLGSLGGGLGDAVAVNDRGDVVGDSATSQSIIHPFLWHAGHMTDLGALEPGGSEYGVAADVNNRGEVVGSGDVYGGTAMHAFLWRDGVMTDLGTLGGLFSTAFAINDRGQVVGQSSTASGQWHAFLWENGRMTDLGLPIAYDINDRGQIVGAAAFAGQGHGYLAWRDRVTDLGTLPGGTQSEAHAVNNAGWVTGDSNSAAGQFVRMAFLWRHGVATELPDLGGGYGSATTLNDRGQVLGYSQTADGQLLPVIWQNGTVVDLTTRGLGSPGPGQGPGTLRDINNDGWIAGSYYFTEGQPGAALFV